MGVCVACMAAGGRWAAATARGPPGPQTGSGPLRELLCPVCFARKQNLGQGAPVPPEAVLSGGGGHVGPEGTWGAASGGLRGACQQQEAQLEWVAGRAAGLWDPHLAGMG